jgi:biotin operon repressor
MIINAAKTPVSSTSCSNSAAKSQLPTLKLKSQLTTIITNKDGLPDFLAINIYYDSLRSWYTPLKQHQANGNVIQIKKLKTQGIYSRAEDLAKTHGVSKETIRKKIVKLEKLGLIQRSFKHKYHSATNTYNQRIIYVLQNTPFFFNPHGIAKEQIKEITPQTNAEYIEEKYSIIFTSQTKQTKASQTRGGIHALEDTKELREPFNKLKDRSNESTFFDNANSSISTPKTSNFVKTKKDVIAGEGGSQATIDSLKQNKPQQSPKLSNQRRKLTNANIKTKKAKLLHFKQYDKPKSLADHYPLSAEDCLTLQSKSGRDFTTNAINEILLSLSKKPKQQEHRFPSKASFLAYISKALLHEKRDAVKTSNINFQIKANQTSEDKRQYQEYIECEKFLNQIEQRAITEVSPENQLKAKLANTLAANTAYSLLLKLKRFEVRDDVMEIYLNSYMELTEREQDIILSQIQAVYGYINSIALNMPKAELIVLNSHIQRRQQSQVEQLQLPGGVWGEISKELVSIYGVDIYKNWFSKLIASVDEATKTIEITTSSSMVQDWINSKYQGVMAKIVSGMNFELKRLG